MPAKPTIFPAFRTVGGVPVTLVRKSVKNAVLRVKSPTEAAVTAPFSMPADRIAEFLERKSEWIRETAARLADTGHPRAEPEFVSGERHFFLGEAFRLEVRESREPSVRISRAADSGGSIVLSAPAHWNAVRRRELAYAWYRAELEKILPGIFAEWEDRTGLRAASWDVRRMKSKWGVCRVSERRVRLSTELAKRPLEAIAYVVCHELVHIRVPNHGPDFYAEMDRHFPEWRRVRAELNGRG